MARPANTASRARLLDVGRTSFQRAGFHASGVQDLTQHAEVPKGSFYSYFESKEAFAGEVLEAFWASLELRHLPKLRDCKLSCVDRLTQFFRGVSEEHRRDGFVFGCLIGNFALETSATSEALRGKIALIMARWEDAVAACIAEGQATKEIAPEPSPSEIAATLIEAWEGATMKGKITRDRTPYRRFEKRVLPRLIS
jgi:TetR/AcrR family transcriptional regulator, transcriptional repressor for nem operon